jgi:hypothetical protein
MATHPRPDGDHIPYLDELAPSIGDAAAPPSITADDIAHAVERLEAGRASGEYTGFRESDLAVLWHVGQLGPDQVRAVRCDPSLLPRLLTPTAHA